MLSVDYSRTIPVTAGALQLQVPADALPWRGITRLFLCFSGANNVLGGANGISQVEVLLDGQTYCIIPDVDLIALAELMSPANINYGITSPTFTIPFDDGFENAPDSIRELSQLPTGQVELIINFRGAGASAGNLVVGVELSDVAPSSALQFWNRPMTNVTASLFNVTFPFSAPGVVRAVVVNTTGLSRMKLMLGNKQALRVTGAQFPNGPNTATEVQRWRDPAAAAAVTDKRAYYLGRQYVAPMDAGTYAEFDTGAAWITGNTLTVVSSRQLVAAKAA